MALMRRCAKLPEKAPHTDEAEGAARHAANQSPSEPIIPKDWRLPRFARKVSTVSGTSCVPGLFISRQPDLSVVM